MKEMIKKVCKVCGSEEVKKDAWASWDETMQEYTLDQVFDNEYCNDCEGETTIIDHKDETII